MQSMSDSTSSRAVQAFQVRSATSKSSAHLWFSRFVRSNQFPGYSITRKRLFRLRIPSLFEISLKAFASLENLRPVKDLRDIFVLRTAMSLEEIAVQFLHYRQLHLRETVA